MKPTLLILLTLLACRTFSQTLPPDSAPAPVPVQADMLTKPALLWKFRTNGSVVASPVIADSLVYITSTDSTLYALDLASGKVKWKLPTGGPIRSSVCLAFGRLFMLGGEGILYSMDKDSGRVYGYFRALSGYMGERQNDYADYFQCTPVIVDTTIYFASGGAVYALSIRDGNLKWTYQTGDVIHAKVAIANGRVYAGSFDGNLYSIDQHTGNLAWKFKTTGNSLFPKGEVMGTPVIAGGMVMAGARDYHLYAIDARGGYCNWLKQFPKGWALPVTPNDSVVYVGTSDDRQLFALNVFTGQEVWKADVGFNILGGCAIGTKTGYFGTLSGKVHGIDLTNGKILWTIDLDNYTANHLKWLKPDDTYRDDIGKLVRTPLDILAMYRQLGGIFSTPAHSGNNLVVAGYDGWVYCFKGE
jgi:outer membrane protein assembly factor BamB